MGWASAVLRWLSFGRLGATATPPGGLVCGTFSAAPAVTGTFSCAPAAAGTLACSPAVTGTFAVEEC